MHRSLIAAALFALAGAPATPALAAPTVQATTQLPRNVRPLHYALSIVPDAAKATFAASVVIDIEVLAPTARITLNAADLAFQKAELRGAAGQPLARSGAIKLDADAQSASFSFAKPVAKGRYQLALDYTGVIGDQAIGLFSLDYESAGVKQRALYTQFENSDARRMIPSWDEPAYKASFTLAATIPAGQMAVSNMPVASTTVLPDGRSLVRFADTPKMSTYLLFFGLGDFERASALVDGVDVGVITKRGGAAQAAFVLDASKVLLREYNDFFGLPFPLPKLDNIAAPGRNQFFGAMENWGAVFTFEHAMLLDPAISTAADKQEVFVTAAHEMAHQWFGDLVTMRWWDDLWLNEGFATWMESRMAERMHPEWHSALGAVAGRDEAMGPDSVATAHPVVQHIETVEQANQAFDSITYRKGEAVIRMLERYVGPDAWRAGVRAYIAEHAYGNTASDDLWRAIEKAAGKPITAIAHDFTLQPGVPLIRVGPSSCKDGRTSVLLTQGQFSRDQPGKTPLRWRVPVTAQVGANAPVSALVVDGTLKMNLPGCGALVVNAGQGGYYRTAYAPADFAQLANSFAQLAPIDQLGLLSDSWALGVAGGAPMAGVLDLAMAAPADADPQVWGRIADAFDALGQHYGADPARHQRFARAAIARLAPALARIGWDAGKDEMDTVATLREQLIKTLSDLGDPATIAEARRRYAAQASDPGAVPGALRKAILGVVAQHADGATWDALHASARAEKSPLIKDQLYELLAAPRAPALAKRALELALSDEAGATTTSAMMLRAAVLHPNLAFDFALAHMAKVDQRVDASSRSRFYPVLAAGSYDPAMIVKLKAYANKHLAPSARHDADEAALSIKSRINARGARLPEVDAWLAGHAR